VTVTIDKSSINQLGVRRALYIVTDTTRLVHNRANILTPVDTGNLRAHNSMRVFSFGTTVVGQVFNHVNYAAAVHKGQPPRIIRPKPGRGPNAALRFKGAGGQYIYRRKVNWPGTRPRPWLLRSLIEVAPGKGFRIVTT